MLLLGDSLHMLILEDCLHVLTSMDWILDRWYTLRLNDHLHMIINASFTYVNVRD